MRLPAFRVFLHAVLAAFLSLHVPGGFLQFEVLFSVLLEVSVLACSDWRPQIPPALHDMLSMARAMAGGSCGRGDSVILAMDALLSS